MKPVITAIASATAITVIITREDPNISHFLVAGDSDSFKFQGLYARILEFEYALLRKLDGEYRTRICNAIGLLHQESTTTVPIIKG